MYTLLLNLFFLRFNYINGKGSRKTLQKRKFLDAM